MTSVWVFLAQYLVALSGLLALATFFLIEPGYRKPLIMRGLIILVVAIVLAKGGGRLIDDPRPFVTLHQPPLIPHEPDNGFPSDHTLLAASLAFLILPFRRDLGIAALVTALLVAVGRVETLLHSPLDVAASFLMALVALGVATACVRLEPTSATVADEG